VLSGNKIFFSQNFRKQNWYGGAEGLVRYDQKVPKNYAAPFSAHIRRVIANTDSIIFDGARGGKNSAHAGSPPCRIKAKRCVSSSARPALTRKRRINSKHI
jgi:hypothetical protein